jgi:hypothetical protein
VGNRSRPPLGDTPGRRYGLYLRPQTRRGVDTMGEFFAQLRLEMQLRRAPSALRGAMQALEAVRLETAVACEQEGQASGEVREIVGPELFAGHWSTPETSATETHESHGGSDATPETTAPSGS